MHAETEIRWMILGADGRHVSLGRTEPSEPEVVAASDALAAQGLSGWLARMQGDYYSRGKVIIDFINDSGFGAIGTPEMCRAQIERLWKQSNGGFGACLTLAHNWANFDATKKSYELIAREVFPHFQGQHHSTMRAAIRAQKMRPDLAVVHAKAVETAQAIYDSEKAARTAAE